MLSKQEHFVIHVVISFPKQMSYERPDDLIMKGQETCIYKRSLTSRDNISLVFKIIWRSCIEEGHNCSVSQELLQDFLVLVPLLKNIKSLISKIFISLCPTSGFTEFKVIFEIENGCRVRQLINGTDPGKNI